LLQLTNQLIELFKKEEVIYDCFGLNNAEEIPGFINICKIISIDPDEEELWINMVTYKDRHHRFDVVKKYQKIKNVKIFTKN
jgi:hypothetical protein